MSEQEKVSISIDGKQLKVAAGTNIIEAARAAGIEIPHYCYHSHLSVAGNCRICKIEVEGMRKLEIACNTGARDGMVVSTHVTSEKVREAQRATLEFLLINHPLDCTICDQAGHCKLQDYYHEYNGKPSRFVENKVEQVKAESLGPEIIYDGERCIMCTRCVRFCDEISETSELGAFNRGDKSVIGVTENRPLDNELSGNVVDLCPVGALTHKRWRFNTRIWNTERTNTICTGCSTGCNVDVAVRDGEIVQVKSRPNGEVHHDWLCNEGRYGFERFTPDVRQATPQIRIGDRLEDVDIDEALAETKELQGGSAFDAAVFLSPGLTLEDTWVAMEYAQKIMGIELHEGGVAIQIHRRELNEVEQKLVSPDYSPNARALGLFSELKLDNGPSWREELQNRYEELLQKVRDGKVRRALIVGSDAIRRADLDDKVKAGLQGAECVVYLTSHGLGATDGLQEGEERLHLYSSVVLPAQTVLEKSGTMVNRNFRVQRLSALLTPAMGSFPDWMLLHQMASELGRPILKDQMLSPRNVYRQMTKEFSPLESVSLAKVGELGACLIEKVKGETSSAPVIEEPAARTLEG